LLLKTGIAKKKVAVLILSPTRELACQTAEEGRRLLTHHAFKLDVMMGGTALHRKRFRTKPYHILAATPGRLLDHLKHTAGFEENLQQLKVLILDEVDQLLELGFREDIEQILAYLPKERQSLMFSATIPQQLHAITALVLRPAYKFIDTVDQGDCSTNRQLRQEYLICSLDQQLRVIYELIQLQRKKKRYKVLVFFVTVRVTQFMTKLFNKMGVTALDMHSRKCQNQRTRTSGLFRENSNMVMFSSDVSARGMDYPNITLVLQVGLPQSKEHYIHRIGRTARAGKDGEGLLLLSQFEKQFLASLEGEPIAVASRHEHLLQPGPLPPKLGRALAMVSKSRNLGESAAQAYKSWLGYYLSNARVLDSDREHVVRQVNAFASAIGLEAVPSLSKAMVLKLGLQGIKGINTEAK